MMGFLDDVKKFSNDITSKLNINKPSREQKAAAANPSTENITEAIEVALNSGFSKPPVNEGQQETPADYYRFGRVESDDKGNSKFVVQPRFIQEWNETDRKDQLAAIRVITTKNGKEEDLVPKFTKFLLTGVQEAHTERAQIVETFGDFYAFFFGERPPIYNFSGVLLNTVNVNWYGDFKLYYEKYLRGTRAVENQAKILMSYQGTTLEGYILNTNRSIVAEPQSGVQFSFQVLVIDEKLVNVSDDFGLMENNGKFTAAEFYTKLGMKLSNDAISKAYNNAKKVVQNKEASASASQPKAGAVAQLQQEYNTKLKASSLGDIVLDL
jgi:hypothetical protein